MSPRIVQSGFLATAQRAERAFYECLSDLPDDYYLLRELKLTPAALERLKGLEKKKPDFVLAGPAIGVLAVEVKDWNLHSNTFRWLDQYRIEKTDKNGSKTIIGNPSEQITAYQDALLELLKGLDVFSQCLLSFPLLTRSEFLNHCHKPALLADPQARFLLDVDRTIFRDDLERSKPHLEKVLTEFARKRSNFHGSPSEKIDSAVQRLIPPEFTIGDLSAGEDARERLRIVDAEQMQWITSVTADQNYLLDVPGSGKTNALISRAIHLVNLSDPGRRPKILITTYSEVLSRNIKMLFEQRIYDQDSDSNIYRSSIDIFSITELIPAILKKHGLTTAQNDLPDSDLGDEAELCAEAIEESKGRYAEYDHVLIDEIQDFSDTHIYIVAALCRGKRFFFVGDIGQKIFEREHDLRRHGILTTDLELKKTFRMYRTPRYIAELAVQFVTADPYVRQEFQLRGYGSQWQYPNECRSLPVFDRSVDAESAVTERVRNLVSGGCLPGNILVITSSKRLRRQGELLASNGIPACDGTTSSVGGSVVLSDYESAKGLERGIVVIARADDLYHRNALLAIGDDDETKVRKESLSRRKLYVALTRCVEVVYVIYSDHTHPFIAELLDIESKILKKWKRSSAE